MDRNINLFKRRRVRHKGGGFNRAYQERSGTFVF